MLDVIFLILLLLGTYSGYKRGFLLEVIGIIALFLGLYGAFKFLNWGIGWVARSFPGYSNFIPFLVFMGLFILIIIIINLIGKALKRMLDMTILGSFDNVAGAILGFFVWSFIISMILWLLGQVNITLPEKQTQSSYLYPYLVSLAPTLGGYLSSIFPFAGSLMTEFKEIFMK